MAKRVREPEADNTLRTHVLRDALFGNVMLTVSETKEREMVKIEITYGENDGHSALLTKDGFLELCGLKNKIRVENHPEPSFGTY